MFFSVPPKPNNSLGHQEKEGLGRRRHLSKTYVEWKKNQSSWVLGPVITSTCLDRITVLCAINVIRCFMPKWIFCMCWWDGRTGTLVGKCCQCHVGIEGVLHHSKTPSCALCVGTCPASPAAPEMPTTAWLVKKPPGRQQNLSSALLKKKTNRNTG